ncbi:MAG TPA: endolytic transglycosylase MltG [Bacteroidales bacterium]|nr:endolytic transglycosylase MltG [Bacteroidales bacterium]
MKKIKSLLILSGIGFIVLLFIIILYRILFGANIKINKKSQALYIPSGSSYEQVLDTLGSNLIIKNPGLFDWMAKKKHYPELVKPGKYVINKNLSYGELINILRSGRQTPVKVTFKYIRTVNQLAGKVGKLIEADSVQIINFFSNESNYINDGFNKENVISVFIPNTYEFYWDTDAKGFYSRMLKEYKAFWNDQRLAKAKGKGLNRYEVSILASIIDDEVAKPDEKPRIAGVYLNRLKRGIPLQACPTIKFALNDFTITRILFKYLQVDSPYNTYKNKGFPPGPIGCPSIEGIDAVLNAEDHDYLYFAAKADFSGYHNFSKTLSEHNHYAAIYQRELNKRKIFK